MTFEPRDIIGAPWFRPDYTDRVQSVVDRYERMLRLKDHPRDGALIARMLIEHPGAVRESFTIDRAQVEERLEEARYELENVRAAAPLPAPIDRVDRTRVLALADLEHTIRGLRAARRRGERVTAPWQTMRAVGSAVAIRHGVPDFLEYLFPKASPEARVHVGSADDIAEGSAIRVEAFGRTIAVFRDRGELLAIDDTCPHRGGPLGKGTVAEGAVTCPLHAWSFDLRSGAMVGNPNLCIRTYRIVIENGEVYLEGNGS